MMNVKKLRAKMIEMDINVEKLSENTGIDRSTFYRRLQHNGEEFSIKEADKISKALKLSFNEVMAIFFSQFVA